MFRPRSHHWMRVPVTRRAGVLPRSTACAPTCPGPVARWPVAGQSGAYLCSCGGSWAAAALGRGRWGGRGRTSEGLLILPSVLPSVLGLRVLSLRVRVGAVTRGFLGERQARRCDSESLCFPSRRPTRQRRPGPQGVAGLRVLRREPGPGKCPALGPQAVLPPGAHAHAHSHAAGGLLRRGQPGETALLRTAPAWGPMETGLSFRYVSESH